jgi:tight adherence protein C
MLISQPLFLVTVFVVAAVISYIAISQFARNFASERMESLAADTAASSAAAPSIAQRIAALLLPFVKLSLPQEAWEKSPLRIRFYNAGFHSVSAPLIFFGSKTLLTFLLPGAMLLYLGFSSLEFRAPQFLAAALGLAATGYYLPNLILAHITAKRQRELFEAFPDALDLMRVCVESGLGLDAAIDRVGHEMRLESVALSDELHLVSLELRAGASRAETLHNLALRVSLEDVDALVAMLVQADRFGTSVAESLRIHSESLRTKRRLLAEEKAAKLPVKLLMPLIFCVFPALLTVLLGPPMISVYRTLLPRLAGQ